jgi:sulfonate transport system substrate-binding protein
MARAGSLSEIRLDYAYYSPASLALKRFGWLERELAPERIAVKWVLRQGSNRALEYLNAGSIDFGSTAGLAALLARANGNPIKTVFVFSRPEWTALVVPRASPLQSVTDLRGKTVAATPGTDPFLFLLRALHASGVKREDVKIVHLQHADGRTALEQGRVDAWAGLDPHMAASQIAAGSRLLYRNVDFNTFGFLNVTKKFAREHPRELQIVIEAYDRARRWVAGHPAEAASLLAEEAKLPVAVAEMQLARTDLSASVPGREHVRALRSAAPILVRESLVRPGTHVERALKALVDVGTPGAAAESR